MHKVRYTEHINVIRTNTTSKFAQHILETGHEYDTMEILHIEKKGLKSNTLEIFHIYNITKRSLQTNDTFTDIHNIHNPINDILIKSYIHK
jgi:hypothetical protein